MHFSSLRSCVLLFIALLQISSTACFRLDRPKTPPALTGSAMPDLTKEEFVAAYNEYKNSVTKNTPADLVLARTQRDALINRIEVDIERNYREYEGKLFTNKAGAEVAGDIAELGISAATGIIGDVEVKDMLSASLTAFKGARLSVDKNYFREKTTETLVLKMRASRDQVRNRITQKVLERNVQQYTFEEAWRDLVEYFYAGTIPAALNALTADAGQDAAAQKQRMQELDEAYKATPEEAEAAVSIRTAFQNLKQELASNDASVKQKAITKEKDIAKKIDVNQQDIDSKSPEELLQQIKQYIQGSVSDRTRLPKLREAFGLPPETK